MNDLGPSTNAIKYIRYAWLGVVPKHQSVKDLIVYSGGKNVHKERLL